MTSANGVRQDIYGVILERLASSGGDQSGGGISKTRQSPRKEAGGKDDPRFRVIFCRNVARVTVAAAGAETAATVVFDPTDDD